LQNILENENDDGLGVDEYESPDSQKPAWVVVTSAIMYACRCAYDAVGERGSETINEVSEEMVDQAVDCLRRVPGFDQAAVDRLAQCCIANYKATDGKDLGAPVSRETMLEVAGWASPAPVGHVR